MLQLIFVFYGPGLMGLPPIKSRVTATLVTFIINYAAYFSEIFRGGIDSIPQGQYEAGQVLGMTRPQVFFQSGASAGGQARDALGGQRR